MSQNAIILIPDISGYTEFLTRTEIDHSSHILSEMLELIIESNETGLTLSEIEGDAVLFYKAGEPPSREELTHQCLLMFDRFHEKLKLIERDTICECGACQTATDLSLKFIAHYGKIKEIKVANFTKASGVDMVIAHRLLKNEIESREYILATKNYLNATGNPESSDSLVWQASSALYPGVGRIEFLYACLNSHKQAIPGPPSRPNEIISYGPDILETEINLPMKGVFSRFIDTSLRIHFVPGIKKVEADPYTERIGGKHTCFFDGITIDFKTVDCKMSEEEIVYVEDGIVVELGVKLRSIYTLKKIKDDRTILTRNTNLEDSPALNDEFRNNIMTSIRMSFENFKKFCEEFELQN